MAVFIFLFFFSEDKQEEPDEIDSQREMFSSPNEQESVYTESSNESIKILLKEIVGLLSTKSYMYYGAGASHSVSPDVTISSDSEINFRTCPVELTLYVRHRYNRETELLRLCFSNVNFKTDFEFLNRC